MKSIFERDKKKRRLFTRHELLRILLKYILLNKSLKLKTRWAASSKLEKLPRFSNSIKIIKRCVKTYRGKSVIKRFRLSRIFFRNFAQLSFIVGLIKKSW